MPSASRYDADATDYAAFRSMLRCHAAVYVAIERIIIAATLPYVTPRYC